MNDTATFAPLLERFFTQRLMQQPSANVASASTPKPAVISRSPPAVA